MSLDFFHPRAIQTGRNRISDAGSWARQHGERCLVCTGASPDRAAPLIASLHTHQVRFTLVSTAGEPTFDDIRQAVRIAHDYAPHCVAAIGGGSALDLGKAVAILLTHAGDPLDYAEVVGGGQPFTHAGVPVLAIPTTAGTGAEATRNAVLRAPEHGVKVSLRSPFMVPEQVILDPSTLDTLPPHIMAATGMDALCQLIEAFVCIRANRWTDALCRAGIPLAAHNITAACRTSGHEAAREHMLLAACWSGIALTNSGLGAAHGFAAAAGGLLDLPHGWLCAKLLPAVMQANIQHLHRHGDPDNTLTKYRELAVLCCGEATASCEDGVHWLRQRIADLPLGHKKISDVHDEKIVRDAANSSSMRGNPVMLKDSDLASIWRRSIEA